MIQPRTIALIDRARSARVVPLRRCGRQRLIVGPIVLAASPLTAGAKLTKQCASPAADQPRTKRVAQERELLGLVRAGAVRVLAVHDARLVRIELQTDHAPAA